MKRNISSVLVTIAAATVALAACGSSSKTTGGTTPSSTAAPAAGGGAATVQTANVSGVGTVLVSAQGRTLYVLTSEKGDKVTCTDASGCTVVWPPAVLASGVTNAVPGSGVQASLLATVGAGGRSRVTYASYPLYTYSGDSGPGAANGKGITSFGGTWWPITPTGTLVTGSSSSSATGGSGSGSGY